MDNQSETIGALAAALAKAQGSLNAALKDSKNPHLKNKYADLASIWNAAREPLAENELAVIQTTDASDNGPQYLVTTLAHSSGEWIKGYLRIGTEGAVRDQSGNLKGVNYYQALGSSISYMRRYALAAIVGVIQDDDDGNASSGNGNTQQRQQAPPPPKKDPTTDRDRNAIISAVEKGEKTLARNEFERNNSRKKHLGNVDLNKASIPQLEKFREHLLTKWRDKVKVVAAEALGVPQSVFTAQIEEDERKGNPLSRTEKVSQQAEWTDQQDMAEASRGN